MLLQPASLARLQYFAVIRQPRWVFGGSLVPPSAVSVSCCVSGKPCGSRALRHLPGCWAAGTVEEEGAEREASGQQRSPASARSCGKLCVWAYPDPAVLL